MFGISGIRDDRINQKGGFLWIREQMEDSMIKTLIVWGFLAARIGLMALLLLLGIPFVLIGYAIKES